jgi:hypothetical protein
MYPYKIADYKYIMLTDPIDIGQLDYTKQIQGESAGVHLNHNKSYFFTKMGRCDAVVCWVDYDITNDGSMLVKSYRNGKFPHHAKVGIKFLSEPVEVNITTPPIFELHVEASFTYGSSDFSFQFSVHC